MWRFVHCRHPTIADGDDDGDASEWKFVGKATQNGAQQKPTAPAAAVCRSPAARDALALGASAAGGCGLALVSRARSWRHSTTSSSFLAGTTAIVLVAVSLASLAIWGLVRQPIMAGAEVPEVSFRCDGDDHAWPTAQKMWCCEHQSIGCSFDCDAEYADWGVSWSAAKKTWCCAREHRGCEAAARVLLRGANGKAAAEHQRHKGTEELFHVVAAVPTAAAGCTLLAAACGLAAFVLRGTLRRQRLAPPRGADALPLMLPVGEVELGSGDLAPLLHRATKVVAPKGGAGGGGGAHCPVIEVEPGSDEAASLLQLAPGAFARGDSGDELDSDVSVSRPTEVLNGDEDGVPRAPDSFPTAPQ